MVHIKIGKQKVTREMARQAYAAFWKEMHPVAVEAVVLSFGDADMRTISRKEIKRRTDIAKDLCDELKSQLHWSKPRIKDNIAYILRCKILGIEIDLNKIGRRASW